MTLDLVNGKIKGQNFLSVFVPRGALFYCPRGDRASIPAGCFLALYCGEVYNIVDNCNRIKNNCSFSSFGIDTEILKERLYARIL